MVVFVFFDFPRFGLFGVPFLGGLVVGLAFRSH